MDEGIFGDAERYIAELFRGESSGHDFYHSKRVHDTAVAISKEEGGDMFLIRLSALLHDADDRKLFDTEDFSNARRFMEDHGVPSEKRDAVCRIISQVSFKGTDSAVPDTLEGKIVQDADRLDAIGAVGIGRAFAYGGSRGRAMHIPSEKPGGSLSESEYYASESTTINHFHEKLLLLKDMMNTETAKRMAEGRHGFMLLFLEEFEKEWGGRS